MADRPPPPSPPPSFDEGETYEETRRPWLRLVALGLALALMASFGVDFMLGRLTSEPPRRETGGDGGRDGGEHDGCQTRTVPRYPEADTLAEQIERTTAQVEALRDLEAQADIDARVVSAEKLRARVARSLEAYTGRRADRDTRILSTLGIVDEDLDLKALVEDILTVQVAGLYLPKTKRLLVASEEGDGPLTAADTTILAHEIQHALADEHFNFPTSEKVPRGKEDEVLAHRSLIEGDATVTQRRFAQRALTPEQQAALLDDPALQESLQQYYDLPPYLRKAFEFPYTQGAAFVEALCAEGGWDLVDQAHREPPETSAEVIYPERFLAGEEPIEPHQLGAPGAGWDEGWEVSFGAADLLLMFELPAGQEQRAIDNPRHAAAGWAGGDLTLWTRGERSAVGIALTQRQGTDLCPPLGAWYFASFPDSESEATRSGERFAFSDSHRAGVIACDGADVRVGIAPDLDTARAVLGLASNQ